MSSTHTEAQLSDSLQRLFPAGIVAAELRGCASGAALTSEELACVARASPQRVREFAAGRLCARRALREFGIAGGSLLSGADRQPVWPAGIVGSISHTAGICVAVVAEARAFGGIGIDVEIVGDVSVDIWATVFLASERQRLAALAEPLRAVASTLIFSAKEAFYKAQFTLVGERLDFQDVRIDLPEAREGEQQFLVVPQRPIALSAVTGAPFTGRYCHDGNTIAAAFAIATSASAAGPSATGPSATGLSATGPSATGLSATGLSTPCRRETP